MNKINGRNICEKTKDLNGYYAFPPPNPLLTLSFQSLSQPKFLPRQNLHYLSFYWSFFSCFVFLVCFIFLLSVSCFFVCFVLFLWFLFFMSVSLTSNCLSQAVSKLLEEAERDRTRLLMELSLADRWLPLFSLSLPLSSCSISLSSSSLLYLSLSFSFFSLSRSHDLSLQLCYRHGCDAWSRTPKVLCI